MIAAIARRLAWTILVVWFVVTLTFLIVAAIPADPARTLLGPHATEQTLALARDFYCLERGAVGQYACWLGHVVHADLGTSYAAGGTVASIIGARIGPTIELALAAIVLQLVIGVPLGVIAAVRRGRWPDVAANMIALLGQSAPSFFVGTVLLYVLAYRTGWLPLSGAGTGGLDRLAHLVLPAATLAALGVAYYARVVRTELIEALGEDYIRTARAKGLPERTVIGRHAMRHALGPLVNLIGLDLGVLLGGAVVVEVIFSWPGLGQEVIQAVLRLDIPLIVGVVLVAAVAIAGVNLLVDVVQLWIDPRLRDR